MKKEENNATESLHNIAQNIAQHVNPVLSSILSKEKQDMIQYIQRKLNQNKTILK